MFCIAVSFQAIPLLLIARRNSGITAMSHRSGVCACVCIPGIKIRLSGFVFPFSFLKTISFIYLFIFCVWFLCVCLVSTEAKRGCWSPWNWSYRWLWTTRWVLGIKFRSSGRASSASNCWTISLAQLSGLTASALNCWVISLHLQAWFLMLLVAYCESQSYALCFNYCT